MRCRIGFRRTKRARTTFFQSRRCAQRSTTIDASRDSSIATPTTTYAAKDKLADGEELGLLGEREQPLLLDGVRRQLGHQHQQRRLRPNANEIVDCTDDDASRRALVGAAPRRRRAIGANKTASCGVEPNAMDFVARRQSPACVVGGAARSDRCGRARFAPRESQRAAPACVARTARAPDSAH